MAETLQRSLLTAPPAADGLRVAVHYQAAAHEAQVGGDWHDSFKRTDGTLTLVIGDVAGHDRDAVALMAQCRIILRGVAQTLDGPPGRVLTALDDALTALYVDVTATAVLCDVRRQADAPSASVLWSNAGHLPPVLLHGDGNVRLLRTQPDLLLGMQLATARHHQVVLAPGSTLVLYTDGLVERKDEDLDDGLDRLVRAVARLQGSTRTRCATPCSTSWRPTPTTTSPCSFCRSPDRGRCDRRCCGGQGGSAGQDPALLLDRQYPQVRQRQRKHLALAFRC